MNENQFGTVVRERIIFFIITGFFSIIVLNLFNLQIIKQVAFEEQSFENSIKKNIQLAPRGIFYDRDYNIVVSNKPSFTLQIIPAYYNNECDKIIENVLHIENGYIKKILSQTRMFSPYMPRKISRDVNFRFISWYEENSEKLPGVEYIVDLQRDYSPEIMCSHMFGYVKEIPSDQYQKYKNIYDLGDYVGFNGLEKFYEDLLRGEKGIRYTLVDSKQKVIEKYKDGTEDKLSQKGNDLVLTIDSDVQKVAEAAFKGKRGALVAIEPSTGEILAFLSAPEYDLNDFTTITSQAAWEKLNSDVDKPLFNRATMSIYSPGSTFKLISVIAALEEKVVSPTYYINCSGGIQFGDRFFHCLSSHGRVDLIRGIEKSCNTMFYNLILKVGLDNWAKYAKAFGFGNKTEIDISEEISGIVPDTKYYNDVFGKGKWTQGFLLSLGIGQGELSVTPLQLAKYAALIASNGHSAVPHFIKAVVYSDSHRFVPIEPKKIDLNISQETFDIVKEGMFKVVNGEGSARNIITPGLHIAGKTGTVQNPFGEDHAMFIGFAPFENPKIAVAVVVENVGFGSTHAAPIAKDIILTYLRKLNGNFKSNLLISDTR